MSQSKKYSLASTAVLSCCIALSSLLLIGCGGGATADVEVAYKSAEAADVTGTTINPDDPPPQSETGTLLGRVVLDGAFSQKAALVKKGAASKDANVCGADGDIPDESLIVDSSTKGVANVFVFIGRAPKSWPKSPAPEEDATFDQKGCKFLPHAMIVRTNQTVKVLSDDPIAHNTHTFPEKNNAFNQLIPANDRVGQKFYTYKKQEGKPVRTACDFHSYMVAYQLPLDHGYAAITSADGTFKIEGLPVGTHKFQVWHEAASNDGFVERNMKLTIKGGEPSEQTIKYPASQIQ